MKPGIFQLTAIVAVCLGLCPYTLSQGLSQYESNITRVKTKTGLHVASYNLNNGRLNIYLPSDMAVGDRVSGGIDFEFYELGKGELVTRSFDISDYFLVIENKIIELSGENFHFEVPLNLPAGVLNVSLENKNGEVVSRAFFPVRLTEMTAHGSKDVRPSDFNIPSTGRSGMPVTVKGPFDGDYKTTKINISGHRVRIISESPRKMIFQSPQGITGNRIMGFRERNVDLKTRYTNLSVVRVSEDQSFFISRLQDDPELLEKGKRGEFVIETGDLEGTVHDRLEPLREIPADIQKDDTSTSANAYDNQQKQASVGQTGTGVGFAAESENDSSKKIDGNSRRNVEPSDSDNLSTDGDMQTDPNEAEHKMAGPSVKEISKIREHLESQYRAELPAPVTGSDKIHTEEFKDLTEKPADTLEKPDDTGLYESADNEDVSQPGSPETALSKQFALQLASLKNMEDADKIIEKLKLKGYNAYSAEVEIPGKGYWYRVKIGGFETRQQALDFKSSIDLKGTWIQRKSIFVTRERP